ncbi:MAG: OmpA family protein [Cyclobacteriaceae bacterium]
MRIALLLLGFVVLSEAMLAQKKTYTYEFSSLEFLREPDINDKSEEIYPLYNKTYDTMYFVRSHHFDNIGKNKNNFDIWYTYKRNNSWSTPSNLRELNNSHHNSIVGIGHQTGALYLINSYSSHAIRDQGISISHLEDGKWSRPEPIDFAVDTHNKVYSFFVNHSEDVILITMYNNLSEGHEDLFVSLKSEDGRWRDPVYLGHDVNTNGYETSPFLTDDGKTMFFTSNGFEGFGDGDVYMTKRLDDTWLNWTTPENLGKEVNSDKFDGYFSLFDDGRYMLSSNRHSELADVFTGKWKRVEVIIEDVKEEVVVKEVIKEKSLMESMPESIEVMFDFNSSDFDKDKYRTRLDEAVAFLKHNPEVGLVIEGNTDKKGNDMYNLILSHKRAKGVAQYLRTRLDKKNNKVFIQPNGELNATDDESKSRTVVIKYILLNK